MRNVLIEISALDPVTSEIVVLRGCAVHATASGTLLDGKDWAPALVSGPEFELKFWGDGQPAALDISYGTIGFIVSSEVGSNEWPKYSFEGQPATVWLGDLGDDFSQYRKIWSGKLAPLQRDNDQLAHFTLLGPEADLDCDALSDTYGGTGGADGSTELLGTWKPFLAGAAINVAPVLIDSTLWIYQVHGYGECAISNVYENALDHGAPTATVSSYAELAALDLSDSEWAVAPAVGMFRLKNEPTGKITADAGTAASVGLITRSLMLKAGLSNDRVDDSIINADRAYSLYLTDQVSILSLIRDAAFAGSRFVMADADGKFFFAPFVSSKGAGTLASERTSLPLVLSDKITQEPPASPAYKVRIGHTRVWSVNSIDEISPALGEIAANQTVLDAKAQAAQDAADAAQAQADFAVSQYDAMAADGVLDRPEKQRLIERFEGYTAERPGILNEADNQGVTVQRTAYDDAYTTLKTYLESLVPAYDDTTQNTAIDANYVAHLVNYDVAKENLRNAIANASAKTANWTDVEDRPTNLGGLNTDDGDKLGSIQTGATVGAPSGTEVAGRPAESLIVNIDSLIAAQTDLDIRYGTTQAAQVSADAAANSEAAAANSALAADLAKTATTNAQAAAEAAAEAAHDDQIAALASATAADTSKGQAETSQAQASTSEQHAGDSASAAASSASVSASSARAAQAQIASTFPASMASGELFFGYLGQGAPDNTYPFPDNITFVDATEGRLMRVSDPYNTDHIRTRGAVSTGANPGRLFKVEARVRMVSPPTSGEMIIAYLTSYGWDIDYTNLFYSGWGTYEDSTQNGAVLTVDAGWQTIWYTIRVAEAGVATVPWFTPDIYFSTENLDVATGCQIDIQYFRVTDITESENAKDHAQAAANSESTAAIHSTDAGTAATSAINAKTDAETAAGQSSTYALAASTSEQNANDSANAASLSQGVSASNANLAAEALAAAFPRTISAQALTYNYYDLADIPPLDPTIDMSPDGTAAQLTIGTSHYAFGVFCRARLPYLGGRVIKVHVSALWVNGDSNNYASVFITNFASDGTRLADIDGPAQVVSMDGNFGDNSWTWDSTSNPAPAGTAFQSFGVLCNRDASLDAGTYGVVKINALWPEDITDSASAAGSASAAANSATTATTKSGEAGDSATAAQTSLLSAQAASKATIPDNFSDPSCWEDWGAWYGITTFSDGLAHLVNGASFHSRFVIPVAAGETYRITARHRVVNQGGGYTYAGVIDLTNTENYTWVVINKASAGVGEWEVSTAEITGDSILSAYGPVNEVGVCFLAGYPNVSDAEVSMLRIENITSEKNTAQQASLAATSASSASTFADTATGQAGASHDSAEAASAYREDALTYSHDAAGSASAASASESSAASYISLASSFSQSSLIKNSFFADPTWVNGAPPNWTVWANSGGTISKYPALVSNYGPNILNLARPAGIDEHGIVQYSAPLNAQYGNKLVIETDVELIDGSGNHAGVLVYFFNAADAYLGQGNIAFNVDLPVGKTSPSMGFARYAYTKLIDMPPGATYFITYLMAGWSGFGNGDPSSNTNLLFYKHVVRFATQSEIDAGVALANAADNTAQITSVSNTLAGELGTQASRTDSLEATTGSLSSSVETAQGAITTLEGKAAAYFQVSAVSGDNRAQLTVHADANGGAGVDIVGDVNFGGDATFSGNLQIGTNLTGQHIEIDNNGFRIYNASNIVVLNLGYQ